MAQKEESNGNLFIQDLVLRLRINKNQNDLPEKISPHCAAVKGLGRTAASSTYY